MDNTKLLYMESPITHSDNSKVIDIIALEDGRLDLILDQTNFYPQGGGQPYDQGFIKNNEFSFEVSEVRFKDGLVHHIGKTVDGECKKGMLVNCQVNENRRALNSLIHSAGHIVDIGLFNLGKKLTPVKGYHFPDGPYIEYSETINDENERNELIKALQQEVDALVASNSAILIKMVELNDLQAMAKYIPSNIPTNKPLRAMIVDGYPAIPCGGTHICETGGFKKITIESIKNVKGNLRVRYSAD